jgi:hypothetical protein
MKAVDKGYNNWEHMRKDNDLKNMHGAACFEKILVNK